MFLIKQSTKILKPLDTLHPNPYVTRPGLLTVSTDDSWAMPMHSFDENNKDILRAGYQQEQEF